MEDKTDVQTRSILTAELTCQIGWSQKMINMEDRSYVKDRASTEGRKEGNSV
jgi:hypothetical protein